MFGGGYGFYDGYGGMGGSWGRSARKSAAAERREAAANAALDKVLASEETAASIAAGLPFTCLLTSPGTHLTSASWSDFNKSVKAKHGAAGWKVKRRVATPEEKLKAKETRKGKTYWIDLIWTPDPVCLALAAPKGKKRAAPAAAAAKSSDASSSDAPAKKQKT